MPFVKIRIGSLAILFVLIFCCQNAFGKQPLAYGKLEKVNVPSGNFFWSELTTFEHETLRQAKAGQDADTLFNLALIMSGKIRTKRHALPFIQKRDAFIKKMRPILSEQPDPMVKAELLYLSFQTFFLGNTKNNNGKNYSRDQKDVHILLSGRTYNCYSSAVTFGLIALKLGYQVQGFSLRDHAFVRISGNGLPKVVDLETTDYFGFDSPQGKARYSSTPGLSYRDYASKEVVPFPTFVWDVIFQRDQWSSMTIETDKIRIAEITGYLDNVQVAQSHRMAGWSLLFNRLVTSGKHTELISFYNKISPVLWAVSGKRTTNKTLNINASIVFSSAGFTMVKYGRPDQGMKLLEHGKKLFVQGRMKKEIFDYNIAVSIAPLINQEIKKGNNEKALKALAWAKKVLWDEATYNELEQKYYLYSAYRYSSLGFWEKNAGDLTKCVKLPESKTYKSCKSMLEKAYLNWSVQYMISKDFPTAKKVLNKCISLDQNHKECQKRLRSLKSK